MADRTSANKVAEIMQIASELDYPELLRLGDLIGNEYLVKAEAAKVKVVEDMSAKLTELGLSFEDAVAMQRKRKRKTKEIRQSAKPKYRSPEGKMWTGRGATPKWLRKIEEGGGSREDYLIKADDVSDPTLL